MKLKITLRRFSLEIRISQALLFALLMLWT